MGRIKNFQIDPEKLLDCVYVVLRERGLGGLTLDAVASTAGISKGGLIHHFPSKRALLEAVVRREVSQFEAEYRRNLQTQASAVGASCRALLATFQPIFELESSLDWAKSDMAIYAASMEDPELVRPFSELMKQIAAELEEDGIGRFQARMILAAVVGLYHEVAQPVTFSRPISREIYVSLKDHVDALAEAAAKKTSAPRRRSVLVPRS